MNRVQLDSLVEKIETLDGSRRKGAMDRAAVRVGDVAALLQIPPSLQAAKAAGSAPTKAEFDALVADMEILHKRLLAVAAMLQERLR